MVITFDSSADAGLSKDAPAINSLSEGTRNAINAAQLSRKTLKVLHNYRVSICFVAMHAPDGYYLKGRHGLEKRFVPFPSICQSEDPENLPVIIPDTHKADPSLMDDPLVAGPPYARFFVGVPLIIAPMRRIGTLCLMDPEPLEFFSVNACTHMVEAARQIAVDVQSQIATLTAPTMDCLPVVENEDDEPEVEHSTFDSVTGSIMSHCADCVAPTMETLGDFSMDGDDNEELNDDVEALRNDQAPVYKVFSSRVSSSSSEGSFLQVVMRSRFKAIHEEHEEFLSRRGSGTDSGHERDENGTERDQRSTPSDCDVPGSPESELKWGGLRVRVFKQ